MTWHETRLSLGKIKRCVWNKRLRLWWCQFWIRRDEFHNSLDIDPEAMIEMDKQEKERYLADLTKRRKKAHQKDLARFKGNYLSYLLNSYNNLYEDAVVESETALRLSRKLKKDIIQAIRRKGLNISEAHFDAIMKFWGIREIEIIMGTRRYDPLRDISPREYQE